MENYNLRGFVYEDILDECKKYDTVEQIRYLEYVLLKWETEEPEVNPNGEMIPSFEEKLMRRISYLKNRINEEDENKIQWEGSKSDFAEFVVNEYYKDTKKFGSVRNAAYRTFNKYKFDFEWNTERCYGMVRKKS